MGRSFLALIVGAYLLLFSQTQAFGAGQCWDFFQPPASYQASFLDRMFEAPRPLPPTRYGFFVYKPKTQNNWIERYLRYIPRKISKFLIQDESYMFSPIHPFLTRPVEWLDRMTMDWPVQLISQIFVGQQKVFSRAVKLPIYALLVSLSTVQVYADMAPLYERVDQVAHLSTMLSRERPRLQLESSKAAQDLRFQIFVENQGNPRDFSRVMEQHYLAEESITRSEPVELFLHVEKIWQEVQRESKALGPEVREKLYGLTHLFYSQLELLDTYLLDPVSYDQKRQGALNKKDTETLRFMGALENNTFLDSLVRYQSESKLTSEEARFFAQKYFYNQYWISILDVSGVQLKSLDLEARNSWSEDGRVDIADLTISLRIEVAKKIRDR